MFDSAIIINVDRVYKIKLYGVINMKEYFCSKCGSLDVFIEERGTQVALICGDCGSWLKWVGRKELPLVKRFLEKNTNLNNKEIDEFKKDLNFKIQKLGLNKEEAIKIICSLYN